MAIRKINLFRCIPLCIAILFPEVLTGQELSRPDSIAIRNNHSIALKVYLMKPDSAIRIADKALKQSAGKYAHLDGLSYYILSKAYWAKANYRLSAEFGFKALRFFENTENTTFWGKSLLSLARTFIDLHNHDQGSIYIGRAIRLALDQNERDLLAEAYREKSMLLSEQKKFDSAMHYADVALSMFETTRDTVNISILYGRKAKIYFYHKDYKNSSIYNKRALLLDSLAGNRRALGISYYQAALDAIHLNKSDTAVILLRKSISINNSIRNLLTLIKVHNLLADLYLDQKKPDLAIRELKMASQYKDSLYHAERSGQIQEMLSLYELSSKEQKIEQLAQENLLKQQLVQNQRWFVIFLLVCVILLALVIFILSRYRRLQDKTNVELAAKNRAIEQQKEEILSQAETLQHLNDLKSKLFSVVSHDLRGPMATLHSLLDLLGRKKLTPDEFISVSDKLKNNLDITGRTLENLLNWSLSQMKGMRTSARTLNIHDVISEASHLLSEHALRKDLRIVVSVPEPIYVSADPDQLHLILRNLIHNAIKFSKSSNDIHISASRSNDTCLVSVRDHGIGMSRAEVDLVLESTNHFSKVGTHQEKGTGLGLLLCKEFIKLNGGEMDIHSAPNAGTEVKFTLPLAEEMETIPAGVLSGY